MKLDKVIVIGVSAGGFKTLEILFSKLSSQMSWPMLIVQHLGKDSSDFLAEHFNKISKISIIAAEDKMQLKPAHVYIAPGGYHMLVEEEMNIALSVDERISYSRPSVDVLFESVAAIEHLQIIAIVLTGANSDGADGVVSIKRQGGVIIAQDPSEAMSPTMPKAAITTGCVDHVLSIEAIADFLNQHCLDKL